MDVTVNENNGTVTVCLMKNITTDGPITVILDAEEETGVPNPASGKHTCVNNNNIVTMIFFLDDFLCRCF